MGRRISLRMVPGGAFAAHCAPEYVCKRLRSGYRAASGADCAPPLSARGAARWHTGVCSLAVRCDGSRLSRAHPN